MSECRCGRDTADSHPCHWDAYTCPAEGTRRIVSLGLAPLPGQTFKLSAYETWACDEHWGEYTGT